MSDIGWAILAGVLTIAVALFVNWQTKRDVREHAEMEKRFQDTAAKMRAALNSPDDGGKR